MKNYNFKKKHTFWAFYKRSIIGTLVVVSIPLVLLILYHTVELMYNIYQNIDYQNLNLALLILANILTFIYIIRYFIFLHRQLYIPISEVELIQNAITSKQEYKEFLMAFLLGFPIRNPKLNMQVTMTSFLYLATKDEQYNYIRQLENNYNQYMISLKTPDKLTCCSDDRCEKILENIIEYHNSGQEEDFESYSKLYNSIKNESFNYFGGDFRFLVTLLITSVFTLINHFFYICPPVAINESNRAAVEVFKIIIVPYVLSPLRKIITLTLLLIILKSISYRLINIIKKR